MKVPTLMILNRNKPPTKAANEQLHIKTQIQLAVSVKKAEIKYVKHRMQHKACVSHKK